MSKKTKFVRQVEAVFKQGLSSVLK